MQVGWRNFLDGQTVKILKKQYGIQGNTPIGIYCGSLYKEKGIEATPIPLSSRPR